MKSKINHFLPMFCLVEKIKKNMEKEGGITFQPYVYKDNKY